MNGTGGPSGPIRLEITRSMRGSFWRLRRDLRRLEQAAERWRLDRPTDSASAGSAASGMHRSFGTELRDGQLLLGPNRG
jgi:hypothetical protein